MVSGITLIVLSILAVPSLLLAKKPARRSCLQRFHLIKVGSVWFSSSGESTESYSKDFSVLE